MLYDLGSTEVGEDQFKFTRRHVVPAYLAAEPLEERLLINIVPFRKDFELQHAILARIVGYEPLAEHLVLTSSSRR